MILATALLISGFSTAVAQVAAAPDTPPIAYLWRVSGQVKIDAPSCQALKRIRLRIPFSASECLSYKEEDPGPHVRIDTANVTGEQLIAEFVRQDPRYTAIIDQDWVVVLPTRAVGSPDYPLNVVVDRIIVKDATFPELASAIYLRVKETLGKELRFLPNTAPSWKVVTLDLSSRTVRSILLDAAAGYSGSFEFVVHKDGYEFLFNGFGTEKDWSTVANSDDLAPEIRTILERRRRKGLWNSMDETRHWRKSRK